MQLSRDDFYGFETRGAKIIRYPSRSPLHVQLVFGFCAYAWDAKEVIQLGQVLIAAIVNEFSQSHGDRKIARVLSKDSYASGLRMLRQEADRASRGVPPPRDIL